MPTAELLPTTAELQQAPAAGGGEPCAARLPPTRKDPPPAAAAVPATTALRGAGMLRQAPEESGPMPSGGCSSPRDTASPATAASLPLHTVLLPPGPALPPRCCAPASAPQPAPAKEGHSVATLSAEEMRCWDPSLSCAQWGECSNPHLINVLTSAFSTKAVADGSLLFFAHWIQGPQYPA